LGRFLGFAINCGCIKGEPDAVAAILHALFAKTYGDEYADAMDGSMHLSMGQVYDNQISLCANVCGNDILPRLQQIVDGVSQVTQSSTFRAYYGDDQPAIGASSAQATMAPAVNPAENHRCLQNPEADGCQTKVGTSP
jgi:hypothetical protein